MSEVITLIPPHEQRILEAHIRGVKLSNLAFQDRPLNEYEHQELKRLIRERSRGFPLQYLINTQAFYGRDLYVNTHVLIPRPETEGLVELALKNLPPQEFGKRLYGLDVGTGSGCIALTMALERPDLWITGSECSEGAISVAEENASRYRAGNVEFLRVSENPQTWQYDDIPMLDVLLSNPPYLVPSDEVAEDVKMHEPHLALYVPEENPLMHYHFLAELSEQKLSTSGFAIFEIAEQRGKETLDLFHSKGFLAEIFKDLPGRDRYVLIRKANQNG